MFDDVYSLKKFKGKPVSYRGKPYMLLNAFRRKIGTEEVFGAVRDVYEYVADLLEMEGYGVRCISVPAGEVKETTMKWDYESRRWYDSREQVTITM